MYPVLELAKYIVVKCIQDKHPISNQSTVAENLVLHSAGIFTEIRQIGIPRKYGSMAVWAGSAGSVLLFL